LRFARHLPSRGWQPAVITLETDLYERYDPGLLAQVPKGIEVIRVRNRDPWHAFQSRRGRRIQAKILNSSDETAARIQSAHYNSVRSFIRELVHGLEACCYHPDTAMRWIRPAVSATLKRCDEDRPEVIWATAGPVSSLVVAQKVSESTGVPFVLDF